MNEQGEAFEPFGKIEAMGRAARLQREPHGGLDRAEILQRGRRGNADPASRLIEQEARVLRRDLGRDSVIGVSRRIDRDILEIGLVDDRAPHRFRPLADRLIWVGLHLSGRRLQPAPRN